MKAEKGNNLEKELQKMFTAIHPADPCVAETALKRWNSIAKPWKIGKRHHPDCRDDR